MFERTRAALRLAVLCGAALGVASARAEPSIAIVPLGFPVEAFRGPDSYLSRVLPTSALLGRDKPAGLDRIVSVWGPEGGAALVLRDGAIRTIAWPATEAASPLAEAPRDAVPGTRMQTAGPLTVYLSQPRDDANGLSGDQR